MKKLTKTLFLFLIICCSASLSAQVSIGPKLGINIAKWSGSFQDDDYYYYNNQEIEINNITAYQFGISFDIAINDMISIQPEILYVQKGVVLDLSQYYSGSSYSSSFEINMNYLEIPILVKVKFGPKEGINFFANAGPSFGYGQNGKTKQKYSYGSYTETEEDEISWSDDFYNRTDISFAFGAGASYPVGPVNIFLEARYLLGLNHVIQQDDGYDAWDFKNTGIGISIGALIAL